MTNINIDNNKVEGLGTRRHQSCGSPLKYTLRFESSWVWDTAFQIESLETGSTSTYGDFYFVCHHSKHRNAKRYNFGCNCFPSPACPKSYTQNRTVQQTNIAIRFHYTNKVETPCTSTYPFASSVPPGGRSVGKTQ